MKDDKSKLLMPLGLLSVGEQAEIVEIKGQKGCNCGSVRNELSHAEDMGLHIGKTIKMLNNEGQGLLLIKVDESRIAIGRGMAMKIIVRRID
jgi:ferrous iron transport protein A